MLQEKMGKGLEGDYISLGDFQLWIACVNIMLKAKILGE